LPFSSFRHFTKKAPTKPLPTILRFFTFIYLPTILCRKQKRCNYSLRLYIPISDNVCDIESYRFVDIIGYPVRIFRCFWNEGRTGLFVSVVVLLCCVVLCCVVFGCDFTLPSQVSRKEKLFVVDTWGTTAKSVNCTCKMDAQMLQKSRNYLKILNVTTVTWSTFHTEGPQILGAIIKTLVATATCAENLYTPDICFGYIALFYVERLGKLCALVQSNSGLSSTVCPGVCT
jgi:hypothetical protein